MLHATTKGSMTATTHTGNDDAAAPAFPAPVPLSRAWLVPAGLALAVAALLGGLLLGRGMAGEGPERVSDQVSLGFVRDMSTHHAQAVRMSEIAHRRSADPDINYLAFDILSTQQGQIGIMTGWLDLWEQGQSGGALPMAWMGHGGSMPGMATAAELEQLDALPVAEMEEQWLRLMIRHHRGAVPMADAAAERAASPETAAFAEKMSAGQQSEIDLMQRLLTERGHVPEPENATGHGTASAPGPAAEPSHDGH
jgi:uncharacterized protein (DUF305 family)